MQHDKNQHHDSGRGTDTENPRSEMDRNRDVSAGETTGDAANADQQSRPAGSHDNTGYPTGNTDGGMRGEQMAGGSQNTEQWQQAEQAGRAEQPGGQNQGQPSSQGQGQPTGQAAGGAQNQPWGQGQDGAESVAGDRTAQASGQGLAGSGQGGTRAHTTDTADQGEEVEEATGVSAEHGNEGSGWHGGGGSR